MNKKSILAIFPWIALSIVSCQFLSDFPSRLMAEDESLGGQATTTPQTQRDEVVTPSSDLVLGFIEETQNPTDTPGVEDFLITSTETATLVPTGTATPTPVIPTRFAVIGDYGLAGDPVREVADLIKGWEPDFIITTGDNNYPDGAAETIDGNIGQYFHDYIDPYLGVYGEGAEMNRFFPTIGNHDWNFNGGKAYLDYFTLPGNERYYDFIWGPVHFFAVDSDSREPDGVGRSSIQAQWLRDGLAASESVWNIVYMHHSPYSSGAEDGSIDWMQWPFKEWGATAVISGHSHVYERLIVDGLPYFVNGLGGGPRYGFAETLPGSKERYSNDYGAMLVEATEELIRFQFINRKNEIIDTFTIENDR